MGTPRLRALATGLFEQLSPGFDPVVRRIALQGKLDSTLRDKVGSKPDFLIRRLGT